MKWLKRKSIQHRLPLCIWWKHIVCIIIIFSFSVENYWTFFSKWHIKHFKKSDTNCYKTIYSTKLKQIMDRFEGKWRTQIIWWQSENTLTDMTSEHFFFSNKHCTKLNDKIQTSGCQVRRLQVYTTRWISVTIISPPNLPQDVKISQSQIYRPVLKDKLQTRRQVPFQSTLESRWVLSQSLMCRVERLFSPPTSERFVLRKV